MAIDPKLYASTAPLEVAAAAPAQAQTRPFAQLFAGSNISVQERMLFTERLALLLQTGMALHSALDLLAQQSESQAIANAINAISKDVLGGKSFSNALAHQPKLFPVAYVRLVAAAEAGGFLPRALEQILEMDDKQRKLRAMLAGALTYPAFLAVFSVVVVLFVLVVVYPKFTHMFASIHDQLPFTTLALMAVSDTLRAHWAPISAATTVCLAALARWVRGETGRTLIDHYKLRVPLLRNLFAQIYLIRLMRVMGASLANGVSVLDALQASREIVDNRTFRDFLLRVEDRVTQGGGIAAAFRGEAFVPDMVKQMLSTGEETGNLALVMERIAEFYERELERRTAAAARMLEPVMLLVMGLVVGLIVSSLILPIFKLARGVH